jgi:hypothetical protein
MTSVSGGPGAREPRADRIAGRYRVDEVLGRGGMAVVYRVTDELSGKRLALKRLQPTAAQREAMAPLFEREYHTLSQLRHRCIIEVHAYGVDAEGPYYTMELLEGRDLREAAPLAVDDACRVVRDVASCLALLHTRRLVHRDVSPRNVRLTPDGGAKLIDFGTLATHGTTARCVGTPPGIAPEAVNGLPLDHRVDLYSLGALLYWALTGEHAYPARRVKELATLWRQPAPPPPSQLSPDVPAVLDELVMSLLNLNPLARPGSAAEVIERLDAIVGDSATGRREDAGEVLHSKLVGRGELVDALCGDLQRLTQGSGCAVLVQADSGLGKSRLLAELFVQAQLKGVAAVHVQSSGSEASLTTALLLLERLLDAVPTHAEAALTAHWPVLEAALPGLGARLGAATAPAVEAPADAGERRARIQSALVSCLRDIARQAPLLLLVDDLHLVDAESGFAFAALAHAVGDAPLMLVATAVSAADRAAPLAAFGQRARLVGLDAFADEELVALVSSLFGEAMHAGRLARWLHDTTGGNPWGCMVLLEQLVRDGRIRRTGGAWLLPELYDDQNLPRGLEAAVAARIENLPPDSRELARALSVCRGSIGLALIMKLAPGGAAQAHAPLHALLERGVLVQSDEQYAFAQNRLRGALLRTLSAAELPALHLRVGRALEALGVHSAEQQLLAGEHLVRGGATEDGETLVFRAIELLMQRTGAGLQPAVPFLEECLERFRVEGRSEEECLRLIVPLSVVALHGDRAPTERHFQAAFEGLSRLTGVHLAQRLAPYLGARPGFYLAVAWAAFRAAFKPRRARLGGVVERFQQLFMCASAGFSVAATSLDIDAADLVVNGLQPFRAFGLSHPGRFMHALFCSIREQLLGRMGRSEAMQLELLRALEQPGTPRGLSGDQREFLRAALNGGLAYNAAYRQDPVALERAEVLERMGYQSWAATVANVRMAHHAFRGDVSRAEQQRRAMDGHSLSGGWTWREDWISPSVRVSSCALTTDVVGLRALSEQLARFAYAKACFWPVASHVRALHRLAKGSAEQALELFELLQRQVPAYGHLHWAGMRAGHAMALRASGRAGAARELCREALARLEPEDQPYAVLYQALERELALADALCGDGAAAAARLDRLLVQNTAADNPLTQGLLHRDRARVALVGADQPGFEYHLARMAFCCSSTENPLLVAQVEKLRDEGLMAGLITEPAATQPGPPVLAEPASALDAWLGSAECELQCRTALTLLMQRSGAGAGELYLQGASGPLRVATSHDQPRTPALEARLGHLLRVGPRDDEQTQTVTHSRASDPAPDVREPFLDAGQHRYRPQLLRALVDGQYEAIGVALLSASGHGLRPLSQGFLDAIARTLCESARTDSLRPPQTH